MTADERTIDVDPSTFDWWMGDQIISIPVGPYDPVLPCAPGRGLKFIGWSCDQEKWSFEAPGGGVYYLDHPCSAPGGSPILLPDWENKQFIVMAREDLPRHWDDWEEVVETQGLEVYQLYVRTSLCQPWWMCRTRPQIFWTKKKREEHFENLAR